MSKTDKTDNKRELPKGIRPQPELERERVVEICEAIIRYINAGLAIPKEWRYELGVKLCYFGKPRGGAA
ncbi:MAG: hypothetical protein IKO55_09625 [Kiritimatiellae bacterium]|nr:hypothetical protein [Kiritimatiellia bacterium]